MKFNNNKRLPFYWISFRITSMRAIFVPLLTFIVCIVAFCQQFFNKRIYDDDDSYDNDLPWSKGWRPCSTHPTSEERKAVHTLPRVPCSSRCHSMSHYAWTGRSPATCQRARSQSCSVLCCSVSHTVTESLKCADLTVGKLDNSCPGPPQPGTDLLHIFHEINVRTR